MPAGTIIFNSDHATMQYCSDTKWVAIHAIGIYCNEGDGIFTDTHTVHAPEKYFDDIIIWRTQKMLYTELGNDDRARRKKAPHP